MLRAVAIQRTRHRVQIVAARQLHISSPLFVRTRLSDTAYQRREQARAIAAAKRAKDRIIVETPQQSDDPEGEELHRIASEGAAPISVSDQQALLEQVIAVRDPDLHSVDVANMERFEYSPIAPDTRWLSLPGMRGVELAVPRRWRAWRGARRDLAYAGLPDRRGIRVRC